MDEFSSLKGIDMELENWESKTQLFSQYDTDGERID